jgi:hypothetical protein
MGRHSNENKIAMVPPTLAILDWLSCFILLRVCVPHTSTATHTLPHHPQCLEANEVLGWSAVLFNTRSHSHAHLLCHTVHFNVDIYVHVLLTAHVSCVCRMQEENSNTKRRKGPKWYEIEEDTNTDDIDEEPDLGNSAGPPRRANEQNDESPRPRFYRTNDQISFLGHGDEVMAHGSILDGEPDTSHSSEMLQYEHSGYWKYVDITSVARGWGATALASDAVYNEHCTSLGKDKHRTLAALEKRGDDGFMIWHEYVVPRVRPKKGAKFDEKKRKRNS